MTRRFARKAHTLSVVALFVAIVAILATLASLAQVQIKNVGQASVESSVASALPGAITPAQAVEHPLPPQAGNAQHVFAARSQGKKAASAVPDGTNPLFLAVVTYGSGGTNADAVAIADVNGDGKPDLVVANWGGENNGDGSVGVLLGNGDGTFQQAVTYDSGGEYASSIAIADVNGDGKPDLLVANGCLLGSYCDPGPGGSVGVLLGNGDGTFQVALIYPTGGYGLNSVALADLNGDGKLDLLVASNCLSGHCANGGDGAVSVLLGNGDGTFQTAQIYDSGGWGAFSVLVADVNGDGIPDLVVANTCASEPEVNCVNGSVGVLLGSGDGTFQTAVTYNPGGGWTSSVTVADVNGDGKPDIVTASLGLTGVLLNNGDGTFKAAEVYASDFISSLVVADVNGDGKPDLLMSEESATGLVVVLLGNGDGTFRFEGEPYSSEGGPGGGSLAVADINGDGNLDALVTNNWCISPLCQMSTVGVLLGNGDGTFQPVQSYSAGGWVSRAVVADLNGDGKPDLLVLNVCGDGSCDSSVGVLLNNTGRPYNPTITTLAPNANPAIANQVVTYTATVTSQYGGTATGTVTFRDGKKTLGSVPVAGNQATYSLSYKSTGHHFITASYSGDADNGFSTSATLTEDIAVLPVPSKTVVTTSGSPSFFGQPVTFTGTATWSYGTIPNGETVTFYDGATVIGTGTTASGAAVVTTSSLTVKTHFIKATYSGDGTFKASSGTVTQVVDKYATTTALVSSLNPSAYGQAVTFTATVTSSGPGAPTGKVVFKDGTTTIGSATLSSSVAALPKSKLAVGSHSITAEYEGNAASAKSTSAVLTQVVNPASTTTVITSSVNPSSSGQTVTFTATVTSSTGAHATGTVTFTAGAMTLGTVPLNGIIASISTATLPVGSTIITATYNGATDFTGSSGSLTQTVQP